MSVEERQMVWVWWRSNWYGCGEATIGRGVVEEQLIWLW